MPLQIVRRDIVEMSCDAIVNPSNTQLEPGGGVDLAIHTAAGPELSEYCRRLGGCEVGKTKVSPGFALPCNYVIHTVGPLWDQTPKSEFLLEQCYIRCLDVATNLSCQSIAFPLISAGTHGFPKDKVMQIALNAIASFLTKHDLMIYLVIYDRESYSLREGLDSRIRSYINRRYVWDCFSLTECCMSEPAPTNAETHRKALSAKPKRASNKPSLYPSATYTPQCASPIGEQRSTCKEAKAKTLEDYIKLDKKFAYKLSDLIAEKGMTSVECYKKANVSKQTWYKIETDPNYKPNKKTVLSFAIALKLTLSQTQSLLSSVGFVLSNSSLFDVILMYCIENNIYNVHEIDAILFQYDQETLFSKSA